MHFESPFGGSWGLGEFLRIHVMHATNPSFSMLLDLSCTSCDVHHWPCCMLLYNTQNTENSLPRNQRIAPQQYCQCICFIYTWLSGTTQGNSRADTYIGGQSLLLVLEHVFTRQPGADSYIGEQSILFYKVCCIPTSCRVAYILRGFVLHVVFGCPLTCFRDWNTRCIRDYITNRFSCMLSCKTICSRHAARSGRLYQQQVACPARFIIQKIWHTH